MKRSWDAAEGGASEGSGAAATSTPLPYGTAKRSKMEGATMAMKMLFGEKEAGALMGKAGARIKMFYLCVGFVSARPSGLLGTLVDSLVVWSAKFGPTSWTPICFWSQTTLILSLTKLVWSQTKLWSKPRADSDPTSDQILDQIPDQT